MTLRIYNTLTEKKEEFIPLNKNKVKIFTCGPTVYDSPHLGHARTYIFYDVMIRYLKLKYNVEYIVNITDIDDKIYQRALELKVDPNHLTTKYTTEFIECIKQLNIQDIKYKKASDHLSEIFNQIKILLNKGFAYKIKDEVYFKFTLWLSVYCAFATNLFPRYLSQKFCSVNLSPRIRIN